MQVTRNTLETGTGPAEWFTGSVYIDTIAAIGDESQVALVLMNFAWNGLGGLVEGRTWTPPAPATG